MTRKDYKIFAEIIREARCIGTTDTERHLIDIIANDMAKVFAADNSRFDHGRFFAACSL